MAYALGVDLGGRSVTVASSEPDGATHRSRTVPVAPAPVDLLVERLGDPIDGAGLPGSTAAHAELAALVAARVTDVVTHEGAAPRTVAVAHPATWGPYRTALLRDALARHSLPPVELVPDALALVEHAVASGRLAVAPAGLVAVLDVRAEHLAVAVVRTAAPPAPAQLVGTPRHVTDLGGLDVEDAVLAHVVEVAATRAGAGSGRPERSEATALRAACRTAAAELLTGTATTVAWTSGGAPADVRVVPSELDARLRPRASRAVATAATAVAVAAPGGVDAVLVTGRLAALPLVGELVAARFEAPVVTTDGGDDAAALGAATAAATLPRRRPARVAGRHADAPPTPARPAPATAPRPGRPRRGRPRRGDRRPVRVAALAGTGVVALGILALAVSEDAFAHGPDPSAAHVTSAAPSTDAPLWARSATPAPAAAPTVGPASLPDAAGLAAATGLPAPVHLAPVPGGAAVLGTTPPAGPTG